MRVVSRSITLLLLVAALPGVGLHACSRCAVAGSHPSLAPRTEEGTFRGGWEVRAIANGTKFFSRTAFGLGFETSYRTAGAHADRRGRFSIGLQGGYYPSFGNWSDFKYDIAHLSRLNLNVPAGTDASVRIGNVDVHEGELLLIPKDGVGVAIQGQLSWSPSGSDVVEYVVYRPTNFSMSMASIGIPLRWYFGTEDPQRPRFYAELGLDVDILITRADYEVTTEAITFDQNQLQLSYSMVVRNDTEPIGGAVSSNALFTRVHVAAGISYRRFAFFLECGRLMASNIDYYEQRHDRMRGNVLSVPFLAGVDTDDEVSSEIENDGAVVFGRTDMPKGSNGSSAESADRVNGISRFWNGQQWSLGISFRLR